MDIASSRIEDRVSPNPHVVLAQRTDKRSLIRELARKYPDATPDQLVATCAEWGLPVSAVLAARIVQAVRAEQRSADAS